MTESDEFWSVAITGGRDHWPTREEMGRFERLWSEMGANRLLHGACPTGVDQIVPWYVHVQGWYDSPFSGTTIHGVPVNHSIDGPWPAAGPRRNGRMLDLEPRALIAFKGNRGTADCIRQAKARGIPVYLAWEQA